MLLENKVKKVEWNLDREGFVKDWLWQYGHGPFEVLEEREVFARIGVLGTGTTSVEIPFEAGILYRIKIPETAHNYRPGEIINCKTVTFHSKWLRTIK